MTTTELDRDLRLKTFKHSSSFTPGDPFSFSIDFGNGASLPGKYDPAEYISRLGVDVVGKNVLVVCPGNAGLAVECVKGCASTVVILEPRIVYHRALGPISEFATEVVGASFSQRRDEKLVEMFDIVLWSEGLDEVSGPKGLLQKVLDSMRQGGSLYVEVNHGHQTALQDSVNSWRPTKEAFQTSLAALADLEFVSELQGRSQTRTIYTITNNSLKFNEAASEGHKVDQKVNDLFDSCNTVTSSETKDGATESKVVGPAKQVDPLVEAGILPEPTAAEKVAAKIKEIIPVQEGELDSVYEGRAYTPKSKKKKTKAKQSKKINPKSK